MISRHIGSGALCVHLAYHQRLLTGHVGLYKITDLRSEQPTGSNEELVKTLNILKPRQMT